MENLKWRRFKKFAKFITRIVLGMLFYRVKLNDVENIPESGPVIVCANHKGMLDMFFIGYKIKRWVHYMAKEELFGIPILGLILKMLGSFPVKRGKGDVYAVKTGLSVLKQGHMLGVFPEGTRVKDGKRQDVKIRPGLALFAIKSGAPILPVAVEGCYKPGSKINVTFGKPFKLDIDKNKKYTIKDMTEISKGIMEKVYSLMEVKD